MQNAVNMYMGRLLDRELQCRFRLLRLEKKQAFYQWKNTASQRKYPQQQTPHTHIIVQ